MFIRKKKETTKEKGGKCSLPAGVFLAVILFFMCSIGLRFVGKNLFWDRLGMRGTAVRLLLSGMEAVEGENGKGDQIPMDWAGMYPFSQETGAQEAPKEALTNRVASVREKLEGYCTTDLLWQKQFVQAGDWYNRAIGFRVAQGNSQVITMNNGYLTYKSLQIDTRKMQDSVAALYESTAGLGIDFLYVQMPAKVCPYDRQLSRGAVEYSNENADSLLEGLRAREVPVFDFREALRDSGRSWYSLFYKTDHHWNTEAGLWAAGVLAGKLNEDFGYAFDLSLFDTDRYEVTTYEKVMYGAQAKAIGAPEGQYEEDYQTFLPVFPTQLEVTVPSRGVKKTGAFGEVMLDASLLSHLEEYEQRNPYGIVTVRNDAAAAMKNLLSTHNPGKKLLFIQDSYCYYVTPYLALDAPEILTLYPGEFTGSIRSFIEKNRPDLVVVALSAAEIQDYDPGSHTGVYDLR